MHVTQVIAWILLLAVLVSLVSRRLTVASQTLIIVATFAPYFVFVALVAALLFALAGSPVGVVIAAVLAVSVAAVHARPLVAGPRPAAEPGLLTVMSSNILVGRGDPARILEAARSSDVDVLALQEVTPEAVEALQAAGIDAAYPYSLLAPAPLWNGVALWSRYPLREPRIEVFGELLRVEAVLGLDAEHPDEDPSVISLHIHAPWPAPPQPWLDQLAGLRTDLLARTRPVIAMGDFNATFDHRPFRDLLAECCTDAAVTARAWWRPTYPSFRLVPPLITIDHVLMRGLRASRVSTARIAGSDHLAVIATLHRQPV